MKKRLLYLTPVFIVFCFLFYLILCVTKYYSVLKCTNISFEYIMAVFSYPRAIVSTFFSFSFVSFLNIFIKNKEMLEKQNEVILYTLKNQDKTINRFENFANLLPEGLYETDMFGNITFVTDNLYELFDLNKKDSILDKNIFDFVSVEHAEIAKKNFSERVSNVESLGVNEYNIITKKGNKKTILLHAMTRFNDVKDIIGTRGIILDVTAINKIKQDYKFNYNLLRSIFDTIPIPMFLQNMKGEITDYNTSFSSFIKRGDDLKGKTIFDIFSNDASKTFYKNTLELMRFKHTSHQFSLNINGIEDLIIQAKIINEEEKLDSNIINIIQDFSDIASVKDTLRISQETFSALTDDSVLGIFIMKNNKIEYMNNKISEITGYRKEEFLSIMDISKMDINKMVHEGDIEKFKTMYQVVQKQDQIKGKLRIISKSGIIKYIELYAKKIEYNDGVSILGTVIDLTPYIKAVKTNQAELQEIK